MDDQDSKDATDEVVREDRYMISIYRENAPTLLIRATGDQERRIAEMSPEQRARFCHIMGG
jgi:hypothetical protein